MMDHFVSHSNLPPNQNPVYIYRDWREEKKLTSLWLDKAFSYHILRGKSKIIVEYVLTGSEKGMQVYLVSSSQVTFNF